jgi:hypothetical protein
LREKLKHEGKPLMKRLRALLMSVAAWLIVVAYPVGLITSLWAPDKEAVYWTIVQLIGCTNFVFSWCLNNFNFHRMNSNRLGIIDSGAWWWIADIAMLRGAAVEIK